MSYHISRSKLPEVACTCPPFTPFQININNTAMDTMIVAHAHDVLSYGYL